MVFEGNEIFENMLGLLMEYINLIASEDTYKLIIWIYRKQQCNISSIGRCGLLFVLCWYRLQRKSFRWRSEISSLRQALERNTWHIPDQSVILYPIKNYLMNHLLQWQLNDKKYLTIGYQELRDSSKMPEKL